MFPDGSNTRFGKFDSDIPVDIISVKHDVDSF